ncbi:MAG: RNase H family protein [Hungatella sp.]
MDLWLSASPSNYWAQMEFVDPMGRKRSRIISGERMATGNSNALQGLIEAVKVLQTACIIDVHTESDYIISAFRNGWIQTWKQNGWKSAKGEQIKNCDQWQQLQEVLAKHSVKFVKIEREE